MLRCSGNKMQDAQTPHRAHPSEWGLLITFTLAADYVFLLLFWVFILGITLEFLLACRQAYDSATGKMGFYKGEGVSTTWQINIPLNVLSGMMKYQKYYLKHVILAILAGPKSRIKDLLCFCTWLWGHLSSAVQAQPLGMGAEHRGKSTHALEPS